MQLFINQEWFYFFFFCQWHAPIPHSCWMVCYKQKIFVYLFLHNLCYLYLLYQAINLTWLMVSGLQSSRLPSSRLTFLSICNNMRVYITKIYIIIRKYSIKFFNHFTRNKPLKNKFLMLANKNRQLCHTFFGSCIIKAIFYHESPFTHFSSHILIMNRIKY